jgi:hypothetical protein
MFRNRRRITIQYFVKNFKTFNDGVIGDFFEFVKFLKVSKDHLIDFFDIFNPSFVSSNLWNSISSIFKELQI